MDPMSGCDIRRVFTLPLEPEFKKVYLYETLEFPFWGVCICIDFNVRNQKTIQKCKETILNDIS